MGSNPTPGTDTPHRIGKEPAHRVANPLSVPAELIALPPVAFALWLLAGAAEAPARWPLRERAAGVLGSAVVLGPLALAGLGLFGWLLLIAGLTVALTVYATARHGERLSRRPGGSGQWALPRP